MSTQTLSYKFWIDNGDVDALSLETFDTMNPATGMPLARLARARAEDVDRAVRSASRAFASWSRVDPNERGGYCGGGRASLGQTGALARLEALDTGKPIANARLIDVPRAADTFFTSLAGPPTRATPSRCAPVSELHRARTARRDRAIIPGISRSCSRPQIAPAICWAHRRHKPPEEASLTTLELAKILAEAGLPAGVVNFVTGFGEERARRWSSTQGRKNLVHRRYRDRQPSMRAAASTLKRVSLELGGKSPTSSSPMPTSEPPPRPP